MHSQSFCLKAPILPIWLSDIKNQVLRPGSNRDGVLVDVNGSRPMGDRDRVRVLRSGRSGDRREVWVRGTKKCGICPSGR